MAMKLIIMIAVIGIFGVGTYYFADIIGDKIYKMIKFLIGEENEHE